LAARNRDGVTARSAALHRRAKKAQREARRQVARLHHQLHLLWEAVAFRCVLVKTADEIIAVQLFREDRALLTEPCSDADEAARIAERLWDQFVECS
jgi:hypothetical protein